MTILWMGSVAGGRGEGGRFSELRCWVLLLVVRRRGPMSELASFCSSLLFRSSVSLLCLRSERSKLNLARAECSSLTGTGLRSSPDIFKFDRGFRLVALLLFKDRPSASVKSSNSRVEGRSKARRSLGSTNSGPIVFQATLVAARRRFL